MIWLTGMARKPGNDWTRVVVLTNRNEKPGKDGRLALIAGRWLNRWQLEKPATRSNLLPFVVPDIFQRERQLSILLKKKKLHSSWINRLLCYSSLIIYRFKKRSIIGKRLKEANKRKFFRAVSRKQKASKILEMLDVWHRSLYGHLNILKIC